MKNYLDLLAEIMEKGAMKEDRTQTGTKSLFGRMLRFDLQEGFPLITTKKLHLKSIVHELLWFLKGETNIKYLTDNKVTIWNEWADENGELGPVYGAQWRNWKGSDGKNYDQISKLVEQLKTNPDSRRHIVSAWNVAEIEKMKLPPCHLLFQFYVVNQTLSCMLTMRSVDTFLGLPFNIASYSLLTCMLAQQCNLKPGEFIFSGGDTHIYSNHFEQVKTQLDRTPYALPTLNILRKPDTIFDYRYEDFEFKDYQAHPSIKAPIAI